MKVSTEWLGHVHDLRRIAEMLAHRPTSRIEDHLDALNDLADEIEADAIAYAETEDVTA